MRTPVIEGALVQSVDTAAMGWLFFFVLARDYILRGAELIRGHAARIRTHLC
tara:strand:- start:485 stop:640 length:156 start_codon:yes stop_codon:yes gene_type:complete